MQTLVQLRRVVCLCGWPSLRGFRVSGLDCTHASLSAFCGTAMVQAESSLRFLNLRDQLYLLPALRATLASSSADECAFAASRHASLRMQEGTWARV